MENYTYKVQWEQLYTVQKCTFNSKFLLLSSSGPGEGQVRVRRVKVRLGPAQRTQNYTLFLVYDLFTLETHNSKDNSHLKVI